MHNSPLLYVIVYLFCSLFCYSLDRHFGVRVCRWWYNLCHKEPLPADTVRGFIYSQRTKIKASWATFISAAESFLVVHYLGVDPFVGFLLWLVGIPLTLAGFLMGPFIYRLWQKREALFSTVDKVESGEIDVGDLAEAEAGRFRKFSRVVKTQLSAWLARFKTKPVEKPAAKVQPTPAVKPPPPKIPKSPSKGPPENLQRLIDKFRQKGG